MVSVVSNSIAAFCFLVALAMLFNAGNTALAIIAAIAVIVTTYFAVNSTVKLVKKAVKIINKE